MYLLEQVFVLIKRSCQQCHQLIGAFAPLTVPSRNPPCPRNSNHKPLDFQFKEPPFAHGIPKATCGKGLDVAWNHALYFGAVLFRFYYFMSSVAATCTGTCARVFVAVKIGLCSQDVALSKTLRP